MLFHQQGALKIITLLVLTFHYIMIFIFFFFPLFKVCKVVDELFLFIFISSTLHWKIQPFQKYRVVSLCFTVSEVFPEKYIDY